MPFKTCSFCQKSWETRKDFLLDPDIILIGYQPDPMELQYGMGYFNHNLDKCRTTLTILQGELCKEPLENMEPLISQYQNNCPSSCSEILPMVKCKRDCPNTPGAKAKGLLLEIEKNRILLNANVSTEQEELS